MTNVPSKTHPVPSHPMPWPSTDAIAWVHGLNSLAWRGGGATRRAGLGERPHAMPEWQGVVVRAGQGGQLHKETRGTKKIARGGTRLT
jgi:hypothetical protein